MNIWIYYRDFVLPHEQPGGMSRAINGFASALARASVPVTLICERNTTETMRAPGGYEVRAFARSKWRYRIPDQLARFLAEERPPDLTIVNGMFTPNVAHVAARLRKRSIPYLVAPHDPYSPAMFAQRRYLKLPYWRFIERPMLKQASGVQILAERHARWLREMGLTTPVVEVPNGYSNEDVPAESTITWSTDGPPKALFLGRIDAFNKGIDVLIDAVGAMDGQLSLDVQGPDWGDAKRLEQRSRSSTARITFLRPNYALTSTELMSAYDIVCLPSRFEGFGLTVLEAMLAGRVVLVSEEAGVSAHVKKCGCGVVVAPEANGVRKGLYELLERRKSWPEMGRAGRAYALENLRWDDIVRQAIEDYATLMVPRVI